jgi:mono/diheme cytochrome c family protein
MPRLRTAVPLALARAVPIALALAAAIALASLAPAQDAALVADSARFFGQWCASCHGGEKPTRDLDLSRFPAGVASPDDALRKAARLVLKRAMPPPKAKQPPRADAEAWASRVMAAAPESRPGPGRVGIRRLSRYEYRCAIRDLLGVEAPLDGFPVDDAGYGFDNVADVLGVSPLLLEKYAAAAEQIALEAIPATNPDHPPRARFAGRELACSMSDSFRGKARALFKEGHATARAALPRTGDYVVRVRAYADQAGPDAARMRFGADRPEGGGTASTEAVIEATKDAPVEVELRARLLKGAHKITAAFTNDFYEPDNPDPARRDRNLVIEWIEIVGPVDAVEPNAACREILAADPGSGDPAARLRAILPRWLLRAWRRPASAEEIARLATLGAGAVEPGGRIERGVQLAVQAALTSPHFLFRSEPDPPAAGRARERDLTGFELASRLSWFLWSSVPDPRLLDLAAGDGLRDPAALRAEVARMLDDPKASALAESFAAQWLELRNLDDAAPDPARFPEFDEDLRGAMRRETEMLFEAVLRERRPARQLLDADFTFVNERLARHYGIPGVRGPALRRVPAPPDRGGGVLAHASILTVTSNATRTSPVKRGKFVLENILDAPPPPPPPGVGALDETPAAAKGASIRERMERHRSEASCAACHARIDGLGLALEHFDPVGAWRARDAAGAIDASATLPSGLAIRGLPGLRNAIRDEGALVRCLAKKLFVYALGRGVGPADERAIEAMGAALASEPTIADVIQGIAGMEAFRRREL